MICVICKNGETEPGTTTSTLERDSTIILVRGIPAKVCNNCGEAYIDSQTLVRLHNMSPEDSERDEDVDVIVLKYAGSREVGQAMGPVREQRTMVMPMNRVNVDTDQIIPKQFLKRVERTGFGYVLTLNSSGVNNGSLQ